MMEATFENNSIKIDGIIFDKFIRTEKGKDLKEMLNLLFQIKDPCKNILDGSFDTAVNIIKRLYLCDK